ncbi:MAG: hypothetical protein EBX52_09305, partial [Proteobacteria bacterium]|nr:hypothetical protein [Pseudomonadota bacterium]
MSSFSFAGEYYPERLAPRLLGTSQGLAGDCMAEAEVNALEQAFAIRGLPVRLSLFYRHAFNWRSKSFTAPDLRLALDDADQRLMDRAGGMIPEYMWPEDGKGYPEVDTKRPHPARIVAFDPAFPVFDSFGFKREWQGFAPGYSNSIDLDTLKRRIAGGEAITLSIHGDLLEPPGGTTWSTSPVTGLIYGRYSLASLKKGLGKKTLKEGLDHEVQVIG